MKSVLYFCGVGLVAVMAYRHVFDAGFQKGVEYAEELVEAHNEGYDKSEAEMDEAIGETVRRHDPPDDELPGEAPLDEAPPKDKRKLN